MNYVATTLQPSTNAGQMLEYLTSKTRDGDPPGAFDLMINESTVISESLQALIDRAETAGVIINVTSVNSGAQ